MGEEYRTGNSFEGALNKTTQRSQIGLGRMRCSKKRDESNKQTESTREGEIKGSLSETLQRREKVQGDVVAAAVCCIFWNLAT